MGRKAPKKHPQETSDNVPIELLSSEGEQDPADNRSGKRRKSNPSSDALCPDIYSKSCKCKKDSPFCLAGIIPAPGGFRKKGLWQKDSKALLTQGLDPAGQLREEGTPCGLRNLGNTCYVNGALQCLFMTLAFRRGLYSVQPPISEDIVIAHIRRIFAEMELSVKSSVDPAAFAASLQLDHTMQQDGQEFFKLLLSHLENKMAKSPDPAVQSLVPNLLRGSSSYETTCLVCQQLSEGSMRETHFYELDVQVKGLSSLEESLTEMQSVELLSGANQYLCSHCQAKVDATRQLRIKRLPPLLCLSLQRFVFDMKKLAKVKATDKFTFPVSLDAGAIFNPDDSTVDLEAEPDLYELAAVLFHKGPSASHGHYVAHIKEESSPVWWRCDDEAVTKLPTGPWGSSADLGVACDSKKATATKKGPAKGRGRGKAQHASRAQEEGTAGEAQELDAMSASASKPETGGGRITSCNAYMLLYRRGVQPPGIEQLPTDVPASLKEEVEKENATFQETCKTYKEDTSKLLEQIQSRKEEVRSMLEVAAITDESSREQLRYVDSSWLQKWASSLEQLPTDNGPLLCKHSKLDPQKLRDAKAISRGAWQKLVEAGGGVGPELSQQDVCGECSKAYMQHQEEEAEDSSYRSAIMQQLAEEEEELDAVGEGFFVSKPWLKAKRTPVSPVVWAYILKCVAKSTDQRRRLERKKRQEAADAEIARRLAEQHEVTVGANGMATENGIGSSLDDEDLKREGKSHNHGNEAAVNGTHGSDEDEEDSSGVVAFPALETEECGQCLLDAQEGASAGKNLKEQLEQEKQAFSLLHSTATLFLEAGQEYCLLPKDWLRTWRKHLDQGHRKDADCPPPEPLPQALDNLCCQCHQDSQPCLAYSLPDLTKKRGKWSATGSEVFEVVTLEAAFRLLQAYDSDPTSAPEKAFNPEAPHPRMITAKLEVIPESQEDGANPAIGGTLGDKAASFQAGATKESIDPGDQEEFMMAEQRKRANQGAILVACPGVCHKAVQEREAERLSVALTYEDAEIVVELVSKANLTDPPGERKSKRSRKGRAALKASSATKLSDLKLHIAQQFDVHPKNTAVYSCKGGAWILLEGEELSLRGAAEHEVLPDSELRVVSSNEFDDEDIASFIVDSPQGGSRARETGFTGTLLTSSHN